MHEFEAVAMAYPNSRDGTRNEPTFNLYAHRLVLNPAKVVQSITLPSNPNVLVLAANAVEVNRSDLRSEVGNDPIRKRTAEAVRSFALKPNQRFF